jgi:hypothetical protein
MYTAAETYERLTLGFGEETVRRIQTFDWFFKSKSGVTSLNDAVFRMSIQEQNS